MSSNPPRPPHNGRKQFWFVGGPDKPFKKCPQNDALYPKANLITILQARCLEWSSATASCQHLLLRTIPQWNQWQKRLPWKQQQASHLWRKPVKPPQRQWKRCKWSLHRWRHHIICAQMDACLPVLRSTRNFFSKVPFLNLIFVQVSGQPWYKPVDRKTAEEMVRKGDLGKKYLHFLILFKLQLDKTVVSSSAIVATEARIARSLWLSSTTTRSSTSASGWGQMARWLFWCYSILFLMKVFW